MRRRRSKKIQARKAEGEKSNYWLITRRVVFRWLGFFLSLALIGYLWFSDYLKVNETYCVTASGSDCDSVVIAEIDRLKGTHTFLVKVDELKSKSVKANPAYSKVRVEVEFPGTVRVWIEGKNPVAFLKSATESAALMVDEDYRVVERVEKVERGSLEILSDTTIGLGVGDVVEYEPILFAIELGGRLEENFISVKLIKVSEEGIEVTLMNDRLAIFDLRKDVTRQVTSLQLILSKATISPEPQIIDLRFDKPVLKYK
jgi:hypothetical protein